jgi:uncharacterized protein YbbC (DUF1343 family)/CubicO group peptidase (beta-lactamase class C family)
VKRIRFKSILVAAGVALLCQIAAAQTGAPATTQSAALDAVLTPIIQKAVSEGNIPGAVVVVGHNGQVVYRKAFGSRSLEPTREPMTVDTVFDLASLTKCVATTTSMMKLVEAGQIRLNDPVAKYLPEFAANGKGEVTIRQLMTHYSGLPEDLDLKQKWQGRETAYKMAMEQPLVNPPGAKFVYSDINFIVLAFIVEKLSGETLNDYASKNVFAPLGMHETRFQPPADWLPRIAPTEFDENGKMLRGVVHDPTARRMGGVAGHAGLFSTADDLAFFAEDLLGDSKVLSAASVNKMSTPEQPANATVLRGLGWDIDSPFSTNRGELLPVGSYGHTGFTGTSLWIDPTTNSFIILLTNAVHPRGGRNAVALRTKVASAVAATLELTTDQTQQMRIARMTGYNESIAGSRRVVARNGEVKLGIDMLEVDNFAALHPNPAHPVRVGVVANQTSIDSSGRRTIDVIAATPGLKLIAIFSPEHGINGTLDTTAISNSVDAATGATIYSVYGDKDAQRRPSAAALNSVDVIVFDLADAGVRFYTYETTLGYFLEAAAKSGREIVVLDRPNPINGAYVQGPVSDTGRESFTDYAAIPVRHGMTMGELAKFFNGEKKIGARLSVITMRGWQRGDWFDSTGVEWRNPSPNLRSLNAALLYPGIGMIEGTNLSVGRGTDRPFELLGAPWIKPAELALALNQRLIPGVRFVPVSFTPTSSNYANQLCGGVSIVVLDREVVDAPELGVEVATTLQALYPDKFEVKAIDLLMVNKSSVALFSAGADPRRIAEDWQDAIEEFNKIRGKYLLY